MPSTIHLTVPEDSPAAQKVVEALAALGATVTREGGEIRTQAPTGACAVCGGVFALTALEHKAALGGLACETCRGVARRIYQEFQQAALRHWNEMRGQLPQVIRDVRGGAPYPTFYHGLE